jgi:eukaryotic-like serine/threonine-protein kinase
MGSPGGEPSRDHCQEPLRPRTIDRTIAVETKEVTVAQFLDYFPNHTNHFDLGRECPVNNVTWYQVLKYCNKRSIDEKLEPCYPEEVGPNMVLDPGLLRKNGYRLPTEVEAEYISRAGTNTTWYFGHSKSLVSRYGWTVYNSETQVHPVVHPVGRLLPNDFGLFDTVGNVFEWCQDRYYPDRPGLCDELQVALPRSPHIGKVGLTEFFGLGLQTLIDTLAEVPEPDIVEDEQPRVMRGGSCYYIPMHARSALRDKNRVINPQVYLGFRVVRTLPVSPPPKSD